MLRGALVLVGLALAIYAVVDCVQTPEARMQYLPKIVWLVVIVLIPLLGPAAWMFAGHTKSVPPGRAGRSARGPRGPEDDPDFLRNL